MPRLHRHSLVLAAAATLLHPAAPPIDAQEVAYLTRGAVLDPSQAPVVGAVVELAPVVGSFEGARLGLAGDADPDPVATATSGDDGRFELTASDPGVYSVEVRSPGRLPMRHLPRVAGGDIELPPVHLRACRLVTVRVLDSDRVPLAGAAVQLVDGDSAGKSLPVWTPARRWATSDEDGRVRLPRVEGEVLDLTVVPPGGGPWRVKGVADRGEVELDIEVPTHRQTFLRFRVLDGEGQPLAGVVARLGTSAWPGAESGADGHLNVPAFTGEATELRLAAADGSSSRWPLEPAGADSVFARHDLVLPAAFQLSGRVLDTEGAPVPEAVVWPATDPGAFAITDARGRWTAAVPAEGPFVLQAEAREYVPARILPNAAQIAHGVAPSVALARPAVVRGTVVGPGGEPLAGVLLAAVPRGARLHAAVDRADAWARSDDRGVFALRQLHPGAGYDVVATAPGRAAVSVPVLAPPEGGAPPTLRVVLSVATAAFGTVLDIREAPVAGARVEIVPHGPVFRSRPHESLETKVEADTDETGRFAVASLPAAEVDVRVSAEGFSPLLVRRVSVVDALQATEATEEATGTGPEPAERGTEAAAASTPASLTGDASASTDLGTFLLSRGGVINGRVVDGDGRPIVDANVHALTEDAGVELQRRHGLSRLLDRRVAEARSGEDGRFVIDDLPPGTRRTLAVQARGHLPGVVEAVEVNGEPVTLGLRRAALVRGRVVDQAEQPVSGVEVRLGWRETLPNAPDRRLPSGTQLMERTGEDGTFEFDRIRPGPVFVAATSERWIDPEPQEVEARLGEAEEIIFVVERGAVLHGYVFDTEGSPVRGAHVVAGGAGCPTDAEGAYRLEGVRPGPSVRARVRHPVAGGVQAELDILPGENRRDWELPIAATVSGLVTAEADGEPVAGAVVELVGEDGVPSFDASSDGDGAFEFPAVPAGLYSLSGRARGFAYGAASELVKVAKEPVAGLHLRLHAAARIEGRILGLTFDEISRVRLTARRGVTEREGRVDHEGGFVLSDLGHGIWQVEATLDHGRRQTARRVVLGPEERRAEIDLEFGDGLSLSGLVLIDDQPLAGASVSLRGQTVTVERMLSTDHLGEFVSTDLPAGEYQLTVRHPLHLAVHNDLLRLDDDRYLQVDLRTASLRGVVRDAVDGAPLAEARVALVRAGDGQGLILEVTDAAGELFVPELAAGDYGLRVTHEGYAPGEERVQVPDEGETYLVMELQPAAGFGLHLTLVDGRVPPWALVLVTRPDGRPLVAEQRQLTADGFVTVPGVPAGTWQLLVSAPGAAVVEVPLVVPADSPLSLTLPVGGRLYVRVPELAASLEVGNVRLVNAAGGTHRTLDMGLRAPVDTWRLEDGSAFLPGVPAGTWHLDVSAGSRSWQTTVVTTGSDAEVVLGTPAEAAEIPLPPTAHRGGD